MKLVNFAATAASKRRKEQRAEFFPDVRAWEGPSEKGYFCGPRTLPYILQALREKTVSGGKDPGPVYLELLARHIGDGVVELTHEEDHVVGAGYTSARTWRERMKLLEDIGFIKAYRKGGRYARILLVHPTLVMKKLHESDKLRDRIWKAYRDRQIDAKEPSAQKLLEGQAGAVA